MRDLAHVAVAVALCGGIAYVDVQTTSDITEAFLVPLAFILVYPLKRDWATAVVALAAIAAVVAGALFEPPGESLSAMAVNRGMTIVVVIGVAFLLNRVTRSERQLVHIATTDPLTGIFNRRHLLALLAREHQRAERYKTGFSLLMLDIDHFKRINDTHGHHVGDDAIKAMTRAATRSLRPSDVIGRVGGEEFVVLLPHTEETGAIAVAERIRAAVGAVTVPAGDQTVRFTISIGVATQARRASAEQLLDCADKALYAAKAGGRDQVCIGRLAEAPGAAGRLATA
jgi:diguanylate cyclase (GGDEF)-like protein